MQRCTGITIAALTGLALAGAFEIPDIRARAAGKTASTIGQATAKPAAPAAAAAAQTGVPGFQVETLWPKPLPNHWILGSVTGVAVDAQDHIWIVHRGADSLTGRTENGLGTNPPTAENCCLPAPPVLEFDTAGTLLSHWGGPGQGYDWPKTPGGIAVDAKGNVWIAAAGWPEPPGGRAGGAGRAGAAGRGGAAGAAAGEPPAPAPPPPPPSHDAHILKFSRTGQFLAQYGKPGTTDGSASKTSFNRPANLDIDAAANEVYVADGYGNKRVVVLDANTGAYKRHWGAYGAAPDDAAATPYEPQAPAAKQFRAVSCVVVAKDGSVYVCDRTSNRIQVFKKDGTFAQEMVIAKETRSNGSVWDIAFSSDAAQRYMFVADGQSHTIRILQRNTLAEVGVLGTGGRIPGRFNAPGSVATDSRGNLYTGETFEGKRVQKFTPRR
jgi:DNA-binding beta-propeller fold protein YncE